MPAAVTVWQEKAAAAAAATRRPAATRQPLPAGADSGCGAHAEMFSIKRETNHCFEGERESSLHAQAFLCTAASSQLHMRSLEI